MANLNRKCARPNETKCTEFIYHIFFLFSFNTPNAKLSEKHHIKTKKEADKKPPTEELMRHVAHWKGCIGGSGGDIGGLISLNSKCIWPINIH